MSAPLRIEWASNGRTMSGWTCTDINSEIRCDITKPLPWDDNSVDEGYISHCCEHVSSGDCMRFFKEVFRILKPGGVFRVVVPAINTLMTREHIQDLCCGHGHMQTFSFQSLEAMLYGAGFDVNKIRKTGKKPIDNHADTIGVEKDYLESLRVEAQK